MNLDCIDTSVFEVALVCMVKVQAGVDVRNQLTRLPVTRRVSIQRGGSSPFGLEKAVCIVTFIITSDCRMGS